MSVRRISAVVAAIAAVSVGPVSLGALPAAAAGDTTAPVVHVRPTPMFVVGSTIGPSSYDPDYLEAYTYTTSIAERLRWSGTDAESGICDYAAYVQTNGGYNLQIGVYPSTRHSLPLSGTDYDGAYGGGSLAGPFEWTVFARDCAGNIGWAHARYATEPVVVQEDGGTAALDRPLDFEQPAVTYSGTWTRELRTDYSGGAADVTTARHASVTYAASFRGREPVALVTTRSPQGGWAYVLLDGTPIGLLSTYSATTKYRSVVWQMRMPAGRHSVTFVNAGHKPLVFDAMLHMRAVPTEPQPGPGPELYCPTAPSDCFVPQ